MFLDYNSSSVRFTGRFAELNNTMTATATGSAIEIAFKGDSIVCKFDLTNQHYPYPHIWIQLDNGGWVEAQLDWFLRINASAGGEHILKIVLKSIPSNGETRWNLPLCNKLSFVGAEADCASVLPEDNRKTIEIIGDSITEGVEVDTENRHFELDSANATFTNDVFATYGYILSQNLHLKPIHMGYGSVGFTKGGLGDVPAISDSYDYCFRDAPVTYNHPDYILINLGVNDTLGTVENYICQYERFLNHLIKVHPNSEIIAVNCFRGDFRKETEKMVARFNTEHNSNVFYIDSTGWVPVEPIHPTRENHRKIADHLTAILKEKYFL